jgi:enoyl reductase-like protein
MDKLTTYFVDENVIAILFGEDDDQKISEIKDRIDGEVIAKIQETVIQHLLGKGLSEDQAKFVSDTDWEKLPQEWQAYLKDVELLTKINSTAELIYKSYFVDLFPKLSTENQDLLVKYVNNIANAAKVVTESRDEIQKTIAEMMQKYNVTTEEELLEKVKAENLNKSTSSPVVSIPITDESKTEVVSNNISEHILQGLQTANQNGTSPLLKKILEERINNLKQNI